MTPTPAQIARLMALPLAARRLLPEQGGPGWYVCDLVGSRPVVELRLMPPRIVEGEAWAPCDTAAWMRAATPTGGVWRVVNTHALIRSTPWIDADDWSDPDPINCALAALEATHAR